MVVPLSSREKVSVTYYYMYILTSEEIVEICEERRETTPEWFLCMYVEFSYKTTLQGKKEGDMLYSKRSLLLHFFDNINSTPTPIYMFVSATKIDCKI